MTEAAEQGRIDRERRDAQASQRALQAMQAAGQRMAANTAVRLSDNRPFIDDLRLMGVRI